MTGKNQKYALASLTRALYSGEQPHGSNIPFQKAAGDKGR
jgi:hypothetical protein